MANFSGYFIDHVSRKLQDVVLTDQDKIKKETRIAILLQILAKSENPAFRAAFIVALKASQTIDNVQKEIANPSFFIEDFEKTEINKPANFTKQFNPYDEFVHDQIEEDLTIRPATHIKDTVNLIVGTQLVAKIVKL